MGGIITGIKNNLKEDKATKREHQDIHEKKVILQNKIWQIYLYVKERVEYIKQEHQIRIKDN